MEHPRALRSAALSSSSVNSSSSNLTASSRPIPPSPSPSNASTSQDEDDDDDEEDVDDEEEEEEGSRRGGVGSRAQAAGRSRREHADERRMRSDTRLAGSFADSFADSLTDIDADDAEEEDEDAMRESDIGEGSSMPPRDRRATLTGRDRTATEGANDAGTKRPKARGKTPSTTSLPRPRSLVGSSPIASTDPSAQGQLTFDASWIAAQDEPGSSRRKNAASLAMTATAKAMDLARDRPSRTSPSNLPHEILLHIFKYLVAFPSFATDLRSCLTVCKSWCLCGVELLWHRPTFYHMRSLGQLIKNIKRPGQTFEYASFIRRLNFSALGPDLTDTILEKMDACARLERLTLSSCKLITDESLTRVLANAPQLVAIDLTDVVSLTDATLFTLAKSCPRLQGINLTGCIEVTSDGVSQLAMACPLLRRVKLCGCKNLDDAALICLTAYCPVLLEVDLINCPLITDISAAQIFTRSVHLRELRLANCASITDDSFPQSTAQITTIRGALPGPPLRALKMLEEEINRIEEVGKDEGGVADENDGTALSRLSRNGKAAPKSQRSLADASSILAHSRAYQQQLHISAFTTPTSLGVGYILPSRMFDQLRILDLTSCALLTDAAIAGIVAAVPRIRNLILAKCVKLTDKSIFEIARLGKHLHYLHLGHVGSITDKAVIHLANSCTRMRYVDLACCTRLTDQSVLEIAMNLPKLRRIGLVRVANLTDRAITALVERHTSLERIHLSYCDNITVPAVFWLLLRLQRLTHLSLTGVPAFRRPELQSMCRAPPTDFNTHQRQAFCVYSGKGVSELRKYLQQIFLADGGSTVFPSFFGEITPHLRGAIGSILLDGGNGDKQSRRRGAGQYETGLINAGEPSSRATTSQLERLQQRHAHSQAYYRGGAAGGDATSLINGLGAAERERHRQAFLERERERRPRDAASTFLQERASSADSAMSGQAQAREHGRTNGTARSGVQRADAGGSSQRSGASGVAERLRMAWGRDQTRRPNDEMDDDEMDDDDIAEGVQWRDGSEENAYAGAGGASSQASDRFDGDGDMRMRPLSTAGAPPTTPRVLRNGNGGTNGHLQGQHQSTRSTGGGGPSGFFFIPHQQHLQDPHTAMSTAAGGTPSSSSSSSQNLSNSQREDEDSQSSALDALATPPVHGVQSAGSQVAADNLRYWRGYGS